MTEYQSKYYANYLALHQPNHWVQKLWSSLLNATIDLNPHQIDWALFFFDNPLNKWVMLADEVWLWKTIEAWLVLCQLWSERKRKILLVVPASLRKQWVAELQEKFHLPAKILDWPLYRKLIEKWVENPFDDNAILVTSYSFAASENTEKYNIGDQIEAINWDLIVFDEAHKLRNVYRDLDSDLDEFIGKIEDKEEVEKKRTTSKKLFDRFEENKKLLLTATPLQNSLLELFWLLNFLDPYSFADLWSFKDQYNPKAMWQKEFADLRSRIQPYFHRTLRKQIASDIKYTARKSITQEYERSEEEATFYDKVTEFLRTSSLFQNKAWQTNYLVVLIYWKLLASSVPAVLWTLKWLKKRILKEIDEIKNRKRSEEKEEITDDTDFLNIYEEKAEDKYTSLDNTIDEKIDEETEKDLEYQLTQIDEIVSMWEKIEHDNKAQALLKAINTAYEELQKLWARKKVLIFTESRRTQDYLFKYLENNWFSWKIVCFNWDNNSPMVRKIYNNWKVKYEHTDYFSWSLSSDTRAAIVDYFKSDAEIMIATESAAEWVNLQFCSLVINYDLPRNPQRVEQRIWRCHRYGQEFDVIVMNVINTANRADQRVFELLTEKFSLFQWLFWASDTILWALESWIDIEKSILEIYQTCRTKDEIDQAFDRLQEDMAEAVNSKMEETKAKVIDSFDEDVARRLKDKKENAEIILWVMKERLINLVKLECEWSIKEISSNTLELLKSPKEWISAWVYSFDTKKHPWYLLWTSDWLWQYCINEAIDRDLDDWWITFDLTNHKTKISILEKLKWKSWCIKVSKLTIDAYSTEEYLIHSWFTDNWDELDEETISKMLNLTWEYFETSISESEKNKLDKIENKLLSETKSWSREANQEYFETEMDKLDHRSEDLKVSLERDRKKIKQEIVELKKEYRMAQQLEEKVAIQRRIKNLEQKESKIRREINDLEDQIDEKKELLIDEIEKRLNAQFQVKELFTIKWKIV